MAEKKSTATDPIAVLTKPEVSTVDTQEINVAGLTKFEVELPGTLTKPIVVEACGELDAVDKAFAEWGIFQTIHRPVVKKVT
jgi:hypothetical protein